MRRTLRLATSSIAALLLLGTLLAFDTRAWHVVPRLRFGHLTPRAQAHFARQAADLAGRAEPGAHAAAAMYAAAARNASVVGGGRVGRDTMVIDYATTMRWCPAPDEPSLIQVSFLREADGWRVLSARPYPC